MARNVYGGYCRECGRWTPPGFGHFERYRGGWRIHCVECASGRKLPPEGACDNGFECSVCGCMVEDEEHYHVSGVWNNCPQCGRTVVKP